MNGHTPPMLRDAMDDVMSSLEGMSMQQEESQKPAFNPWSPEAFDDLHQPAEGRPPVRPLTSLGLGAGGSNYPDRLAYSSNHNVPDRYQDGPPQLSNYVQRMESRLRQMHEQNGDQETNDDHDEPPMPPPKNSPFTGRPTSSIGNHRPSLKSRKSAYEIGKNVLNRTFTTKSTVTNSSAGQSVSTNASSRTSRSIMSGYSAGGFSATSAGSLARRNNYPGRESGRPITSMADSKANGFLDGARLNDLRPQTPLTGISYHSSHDSRQGAQSAVPWSYQGVSENAGALGGFVTPKAKKQGFLKKLIDGAKTGAASARSSIAASQTGSIPPSPIKSRVTGIAGGAAITNGRDAAQEMGLGGGNIDWVQVRRDVNRSTSISGMERKERADRCQMLDHPVIYPLEELYDAAEGDESIDGLPVPEPVDYNLVTNLHLVDKASRFINSLPPMTTPSSLAQGYVCRPHRTDVQRLRAIFTWVSEKIVWDEEFEGDIDTRRVIQSKRGCSHEVAALVVDMCAAVGIHAEIVRGYLKSPGEDLDLDANLSHPNHYWNSMLIDGEWRIMDCSLASPTNPRRALYSSTASQSAEFWYFLARPTQICFTHIPLSPEHQHICPPIAPEVLLTLPVACPPYFKNDLHLNDYDTSLIRLQGLEMTTIYVNVPADVEIVAEVEVKAFMRDQDGDFYENGDTVKKRALAQPSWFVHASNPTFPQKRFTIKALLPGDEGHGTLKIYAGKRGLMHSSRDNPHPLAFAIPIYHEGENPSYDFLVRHPTPHASRNDLYIIQPQCYRLGWNNTFVFEVRQHSSSFGNSTPEPNIGSFDARRPVSPLPFTRPSSAMSMTSSSANGSSYDTPATSFGGSNIAGVKLKDNKPAKLAIQSPSGRILRLTRKQEYTSTAQNADGTEIQGSVWETVVKVGERGVWRGLVLADRSARWCVWGEWECV
ncbi:putative sh3 domain protein [Phaeomoniella chlamydospora]|uniref:Putative sh3 domain protein n=1 Tax=Phaeomoniella chlamydospora TaxID=158046 RepID=A0A0G2FVI2_PHACM|nr:putative sh3 domain protein [Phaeomoniella chlamydospora]